MISIKFFMYQQKYDKRKEPTIPQEKVDEIFTDFESRSNIVGLFDLLLKIDRHNNPKLYQEENHD
ncbi:MAG: hypothetical protein COT25_01005 [Candidatus Kerfeldbacteria bacterium CG08_land_8_20_14_0_20_42_7]|uniref:Uncharacterized protein n=1 Tax=Candidatus Kerfeldbacteria bacterium CG08_land_8_20_14_0_20_42_7 TaxID=2014245 RepID=A0A2H0YTR4_9BACT|nr:MAG: hypothetical protein COT25_01005 [Candidatus Kerfeldbacteria bacterium CG08_land_8_20_14_0_20_42_7]